MLIDASDWLCQHTTSYDSPVLLAVLLLAVLLAVLLLAVLLSAVLLSAVLLAVLLSAERCAAGKFNGTHRSTQNGWHQQCAVAVAHQLHL